MVKLDEDRKARPAPRPAVARTGIRPTAMGGDDENVDLNKFSSAVLKQLLAENIQPTPENFDIYFRK